MPTKEAEQYDRALKVLELTGIRRLRQILLDNVTGVVLEVGTGTGANLPVYDHAERVVGIDIDVKKLTGTAVRTTTIPFDISQADAHRLPFADNQFDNVVGTLVFCSIPQPALALTEIKRVLKPNGRLFLLEHVRGQNPVMQRVTDWLQPAWFALQGECHLNRETAVTVVQSGFELEEISVHGWGLLQMMRAKAR